jgi:hypothetical protein
VGSLVLIRDGTIGREYGYGVLVMGAIELLASIVGLKVRSSKTTLSGYSITVGLVLVG